MLQTISWRDFLILVGFGTALYYAWWLRHYYPAWPKRKPDPPEGKTAERERFAEPTATSAVVTVKVEGTEQPSTAQQPQLAQRPVQAERPLQAERPVQAEPQNAEYAKAGPPQPELAFPAPPGKGPFLPAIEANLKNDVVMLFENARSANVPVAELFRQLQGLLRADPYPILKGTAYQENVDACINRELNKYGSIPIDPGIVKELWKTEG